MKNSYYAIIKCKCWLLWEGRTKQLTEQKEEKERDNLPKKPIYLFINQFL
jgi:hypothetical protein